MQSTTITELHIQRGRQMRQLVQFDIARHGWTFEGAVENLAAFLGVDVESVRLGIAIANEADGTDTPLAVSFHV